MKEHLRHLLINLVSGTRLACFAKVDSSDFRVSPDQLFFLVLSGLALDAAIGYLTNLPQPEFNVYAFPIYGFHFTLLLLAAYLVRRIGSSRHDLLILPTALLSLAPFIYAFWYPLSWILGKQFDESSISMFIFAGYLLWAFAIMLRAIGLTHPTSPRRHGIALVAGFVIWFLPGWYFSGQAEFWYASQPEESQDNPYAAFQKLDAEDIFYSQTPLLEKSLLSLKKQRDGLIDLYFVGFAGYARQDVFLKEIRYAQNLFDRNFDTEGRSLVLVNNLATYGSTPLANGHNLATALKAIGARMNRDEDVLVMYMTSHGSRKQGLSVDFWPLTLNDIQPETLKRYLDDAGIKWRVLMISACYSGIFIDPLKDSNTLIASASAADRRSFGCGDHNDFTYFGEAVLKDQLSHRRTLVEALQDASVEIARREQAEGIREHSEPQTFVGDAIAPRLKALEQQLAGRKGDLIEAHMRAGAFAPPKR